MNINHDVFGARWRFYLDPARSRPGISIDPKPRCYRHYLAFQISALFL